MAIEHRRLLRLIQTTASSDTRIAAICGCSRSTVTRYRKISLAMNLTLVEVEAMADSELALRFDMRNRKSDNCSRDPDWHQVSLKLRRGYTLSELHAQYVAERVGQMTISYRELCRRYAFYRRAANPIMRQTHSGGERAMLDFAGYQPSVLLARGSKSVKGQLFLMVLPASDYIFALVVPSQKTTDWVVAVEAGLRAFGGAPELLVVDNLKAAVLEHRRRRQVKFNPVFEQLCDHHGCSPLAARPRKPQDKAKVEIGVKLVQRLLRLRLENRPVPTLAEANAVLAEILQIINSRPLRRMPGETRNSLFEKLDRPALRPLNPQPFTLIELRPGLKVPPDYHLTYEHRYYSAPHTLIGREVDVRVSQTTVEIWHNGRRVALHPRSHVVGSRATEPGHMPEHHRAQKASEMPNLHEWAEQQPASVRQFVTQLLEQPISGAALIAMARSMKDLARRVGPVRFEAACARTLATGHASVRRVRAILDRGLEQAEFDPPPRSPTAMVQHENVPGADYYRRA